MRSVFPQLLPHISLQPRLFVIQTLQRLKQTQLHTLLYCETWEPPADVLAPLPPALPTGGYKGPGRALHCYNGVQKGLANLVEWDLVVRCVEEVEEEE